MNFTPEQASAICADNRELLVSAAAGSGKTAVLIERILFLLSQKNFSLDRLLVVTYTRAAAAELRERLELRIGEAAKSDQRLVRQMDLVSRAQISTIHSYCQHVVREHFRDCEIDPQFTIGDQRTLDQLYQDSMEDALDDLYAREKEDEALHSLVGKFTEKEIALMLDMLYRFLVSRPDPVHWLREQADKVWNADTLDRQPMAEAFVNEAELMLNGVMLLWDRANQLSKRPEFPKPYLATLAADLDAIKGLVEACGQGLTQVLYALKQCRFVTLARAKPATTDEAAAAEAFKEYRRQYKKSIDDLQKKLPIDRDSAIEDLNAMSPAMTGLAKAMEKLMELYSQRKREQATLDFNDLEHLTLALLADPEIRDLEAKRFDAVFVDEYQDVSEIQEAILNGLKRESTKDQKQYYFYVGDVKQSIYRFRLAEPQLFLSKLETFSTETDAEKRKIILNKNFRSREGVLSAVNRTFRHLMDKRVTEIDYNREAMLYPGSPSYNDPATELHVMNSAGLRPQDVIQAEAAYIAADIQRTVGMPLLDAEGKETGLLHYKDIAILLPVVKNVADKVEAALAAAGVPVYTDAAANAFAGEEVVMAAQHLELLGNLQNDLALLSQLRSPVFGFTEQELAKVRLARPQREATYLEALRTLAEGETEDSLSQRCKQVLAALEEERFLYNSMAPDEYLWDYLMRSGLYAHYGAQPGGKLRQANLRMLCHKAGEYAQNHREGLQGFLESIKAGTSGDSSSPTVVNPWEDVVRIMTIHKSKGLEFPTVYLMGLGSGIAKRRQTKMLAMHSKLGVGLMYRNETMRTKRETLMQSAIELREAAQERAERARVLYVAMTRPKNRLVMIGSSAAEKNGLESISETVRLKANEINDLAGVRNASSYLEWLLQVLEPQDEMRETDGIEISTKVMWENGSEKSVLHDSTSFPQKTDVWKVFFRIGIDESSRSQFAQKVNSETSPLLQDLLENSTRSLPKEKADVDAGGDPLSPIPRYEHPPLKLGVSALCRAIREAESGQTLMQEESEETVTSKRLPLAAEKPRLLSSLPKEPAFLAAKAENRAALRGTATHKLLSSLPLEGLRAHWEQLDDYIKEETGRMEKEGQLTSEEALLADLAGTASFFRSPTGQRLMKAEEAHREWSFNLHIQQPIDTLVQGVIDLCFLEEGQWVLVDFKTDRAKTAEELWEKYAPQLRCYRLALEKATPYPVKETGLYSLSAGQVSFRETL